MAMGTRREEIEKLNKLASKMLGCKTFQSRKSLEVIYDLIPLELYGTYKAIMALTRQEDTLTQDKIGKDTKYQAYISHRKYWYTTRDLLLMHSTFTDRLKGQRVVYYKKLHIRSPKLNKHSSTNTIPYEYLHGWKFTHDSLWV